LRIHTKTTWDIDTGQVLEDEFYEYDGPVAFCGGGGSGTSKDQLNAQNALQQKAFDAQMAQLDQIKSSLSGYLSGNKGFTNPQMATNQSQAINQNSAKYNSAGNAVRQALASRGMGGGQVPGGGSYVQGISTLEGAKASDLSNAMNTINLQNSQQGLTNQFNAASILSGNAATLSSPISTFGSGANNALSNYVTAQQSTFGNMFAKNLGGALGTGLGSGLAAGAIGGLGSFASTLGSGNYGW